MSTPALDTNAILWSPSLGAADDRPVVVLLHGYGADEHDLFSLADYLAPGFRYVSVRAPLTPPWPTPGYSWYPIDGLDQPRSEEVTAGASALLDWLSTEQLSGVGLIGFSQGGAIALQSLRLARSQVSFVANLAGYVEAEELPGDAQLAEDRPPVFWGRGSADTVIPQARIEHTTTWLPSHSDLSGRVYPGLGHSISEEEVADLNVFLTKQRERIQAETR